MQRASMDTLIKYGTPKEIKKPVGPNLHRMDPIENSSRKRHKKKRRNRVMGGDDANAKLAADIEKLQRTRNLCAGAITNLENKLAREMKHINAHQSQLEVGVISQEDCYWGHLESGMWIYSDDHILCDTITNI